MIRRSPLPRGTKGLSRRTPLDSRGPVTSRKPSTAARRRARAVRREAECYGPHGEWIRAQPSAVTGSWGSRRDRIVAAHAVHTRGAGGKAGALIPLLASEEDQFHALGRDSFAAAYGVDLYALTAWYTDHSPALHPEIASHTDRLPCEDCGTRGPHLAVLHPDGVYTARCRDCRGGVA